MQLLLQQPAWSRPAELSVDPPFPSTDYQRITEQRKAVLTAVHSAVQQYIDAHATSDDPNAFPSRVRLTGEYYISQEDYWVNDEPWFSRVGRAREYCFSIRVHCLEHIRYSNQVEQDYLGLEVQFTWDPTVGSFRFDGVDSSSI